MSTVAIEVLLALAVLVCWLGAAGFARLGSPLDRLHCVTFVNAGAGVAVLCAAYVSDGASTRADKILVLVLAVLAGGAALAHATGRALVIREKDK